MNISVEEILFEYWKNNEKLSLLLDDTHVVMNGSTNLAIPFVRITVEEFRDYCPTCSGKPPQYAQGCLELHHHSFREGFDLSEHIVQELNCVRIISEESRGVTLRFLRSKNQCKGVNHWILSRDFYVTFYE